MSAVPIDAANLPVEISGPRSPGWWGMILLICTEAALFASLLASYFYLVSSSHQWPQGNIKPPDLVLPIIMTAILLSSSIPMIYADYSIRRNNQIGLKIGLALSFILGLIFLALQVYELTHENFSVTTNAYGSAFFTITTLHGTHVVVGLLLTAFTFVRALFGHFRPGRDLAVQNTGYYWHFVDGVWIFIFSSLYLFPHFV